MKNDQELAYSQCFSFSQDNLLWGIVVWSGASYKGLRVPLTTDLVHQILIHKDFQNKNYFEFYQKQYLIYDFTLRSLL